MSVSLHATLLSHFPQPYSQRHPLIGGFQPLFLHTCTHTHINSQKYKGQHESLQRTPISPVPSFFVYVLCCNILYLVALYLPIWIVNALSSLLKKNPFQYCTLWWQSKESHLLSNVKGFVTIIVALLQKPCSCGCFEILCYIDSQLKSSQFLFLKLSIKSPSLPQETLQFLQHTTPSVLRPSLGVLPAEAAENCYQAWKT